jgi:hypothetical protein
MVHKDFVDRDKRQEGDKGGVSNQQGHIYMLCLVHDYSQ